MLFQRIQQRRSKAEIARLEFGRVFRAVDTGKVEDEVRLGAEFVQLFRSAVNVVFVNFINLYIRACTVLEVTDIFQIFCEIPPDKAFCACDKYSHVHFLLPNYTTLKVPHAKITAQAMVDLWHFIQASRY